MEFPNIAELVGAMAIDAINVQIKFNQHFETEIQRMESLLAATLRTAAFPTALPELLLPLLPRPLRVVQFDLKFLAGISVTREQELAIRAVPLNAEFMIRTSARTDRHSRVIFSVQQIPISKEQSSWPTETQVT
jgi:hypothetical protein